MRLHEKHSVSPHVCLGKERRDRILAGLYGVMLSGALLIGGMLESKGAVSMPGGRQLLAAAVRAAAFGCGVFFLWKWKDRRNRAESGESMSHFSGMDSCRGRTIALWVLFMTVQMVSLLAVYPGFFVYDAAEELAMVQTRSFTTHHPLLHVLLLGGSILAVHKVTGSYNWGIFCYLVFQMAIMDGVFVLLTRQVRILRTGKKGGRWAAFGTVLWLCLCPVITMFVLCSCKDGLFAAALVSMTIFLRRIVGQVGAKSRVERGDLLGFVMSAVLMMLLRNNGVYAYAAGLMAAAAAALVRKEIFGRRRKGILGAAVRRMVVLLLPLLLYTLFSQGLVRMTNAADAESQEILTVPIMQLARVWNSDRNSFGKGEEELMLQLMGAEEEESENSASCGWDLYNPVLSDQVKLHFSSSFYREHRSAFWKLWLSKGLQHPVSYLNAWLMTSYGFWAPGAVVDCYEGNTVYTFTYGASSYFGYETELPGVRESKLPVLDSWYRYLSLDPAAQRSLLPGLILSPGVMAWAWAFFLLTMLRNRRMRELSAYLPIFFVWLTVLLGPCTLPRYVVYLWIGIPLIAADACR
jgi:hypothetical protein